MFGQAPHYICHQASVFGFLFLDAVFKLGEYCSGFADFVAGVALPVKLGIFFEQLFDSFAGYKYSGVICRV